MRRASPALDPEERRRLDARRAAAGLGSRRSGCCSAGAPDLGNERRASIGLELLVEEIRSRRPGWTLIPAEKLIDPAEAGPSEKEAREILGRSTGVQGISEEDARKLSALAGATHLIQLRLLFLKTEGEAEVSFLTAVFRADTGQKVWEGTGRGIGQHTIFGLFGPISVPVFFRSIAKEAVQAVADRLPD